MVLHQRYPVSLFTLKMIHQQNALISDYHGFLFNVTKTVEFLSQKEVIM